MPLLRELGSRNLIVGGTKKFILDEAKLSQIGANTDGGFDQRFLRSMDIQVSDALLGLYHLDRETLPGEVRYALGQCQLVRPHHLYAVTTNYIAHHPNDKAWLPYQKDLAGYCYVFMMDNNKTIGTIEMWYCHENSEWEFCIHPENQMMAADSIIVAMANAL